MTEKLAETLARATKAEKELAEKKQELERALSRATAAESEMKRFRSMLDESNKRHDATTELLESTTTERDALAKEIKGAAQKRDRAVQLLRECRPTIKRPALLKKVLPLIGAAT